MSEQKNTTTKTIKIPGPAHPITIERNLKRVVVSIGGTVLADSRDALILREAGYAAVQYIPRKDVDMTLLERSAHSTYCPYKGDCAYFSIPSGGERAVNAVLDLRGSLRRGGGHQEPPGFLPRQGGRDRGASRWLGPERPPREGSAAGTEIRSSPLITAPHRWGERSAARR